MSGQRQALVMGLGDSGAAAARLLLREGYAVTVADMNRHRDLEARAQEGDPPDIDQHQQRRGEQRYGRHHQQRDAAPIAAYSLKPHMRYPPSDRQ